MEPINDDKSKIIQARKSEKICKNFKGKKLDDQMTKALNIFLKDITDRNVINKIKLHLAMEITLNEKKSNTINNESKKIKDDNVSVANNYRKGPPVKNLFVHLINEAIIKLLKILFKKYF